MYLPLESHWQAQLAEYLASDNYHQLIEKIEQEYQAHIIYPPQEKIYQALNLTPYGKVKVCILGQDPYHGIDQANGLAFSVNVEQKLPPSLRNIFKELEDDLAIPQADHGDLTYWATQGVLLLNTVLTVRASQANSHHHLGWQILTDQIIESLNQQEQPIVFILWGKQAHEKATIINTEKHVIIKTVHPSPLSAYRGFFGSKPFSNTNQQLEAWGLEPIAWQLPKRDREQMSLF